MTNTDLFTAAALLIGELVDVAAETSDEAVQKLGKQAIGLLKSIEKLPKVDPHDPLELAAFIHRLSTDFPLSVTGWGRTQAHNDRLGGSPKDTTLRWQGFDVVLENPQQVPALKERLAQADLHLVDFGLYTRIEPIPHRPGD